MKLILSCFICTKLLILKTISEVIGNTKVISMILLLIFNINSPKKDN